MIIIMIVFAMIIINMIIMQGIRAMDDSIQTLKDEMNKLMSVYEYVKVITNTNAIIFMIKLLLLIIIIIITYHYADFSEYLFITITSIIDDN